MLNDPSLVQCPYCGESIDHFVDPGGGRSQDYIEDCSVCCRPIRFSAQQDSETGEYWVNTSAEV